VRTEGVGIATSEQLYSLSKIVVSRDEEPLDLRRAGLRRSGDAITMPGLGQ